MSLVISVSVRKAVIGMALFVSHVPQVDSGINLHSIVNVPSTLIGMDLHV